MPHFSFPNSMMHYVESLIPLIQKIVRSPFLRRIVDSDFIFFSIVDLKGQLLGWSNSIGSAENFNKNHENPGLSSPEGLNEEASESVPKRLADLRSRLENKRYALLAAQEASTFQKNVRFHLQRNKANDLSLVLQVLESLTNDCIKLQQEIVVLERLLENVDRWWSFLGQWRVFIVGYEVGLC